MSTINKSIILQFIKKATCNPDATTKGILGKKALQKCIYFFKLNKDYFYFKWADYGPFSQELQNIAWFLIVKKLMLKKNIQVKEMQPLRS